MIKTTLLRYSLKLPNGRLHYGIISVKKHADAKTIMQSIINNLYLYGFTVPNMLDLYNYGNLKIGNIYDIIPS